MADPLARNKIAPKEVYTYADYVLLRKLRIFLLKFQDKGLWVRGKGNYFCAILQPANPMARFLPL